MHDKSMQEMMKFLHLESLPIFQPVEKKVWSNWSLLFVSLPGTAKWRETDRKMFLQLLKLKSKGNERDFILHLQAHKKLWSSIKELLKN